MKRYAAIIMTMLFAFALSFSFAITDANTSLGWAEPVYADTGLNVTQHTQDEITEYLQDSGVTSSTPTSYAVTPVKNTTRGELSQESKDAALAMLNNIRYVAGLNPVSLDETQGDYAQAAAFVNMSIGRLTHYPSQDATKPDEMSDEDWRAGCTGASKCNLAAGYWPLNYAVYGWTHDDDSSNIDRLGHRRWCLNPTMGTTGFGAAGRYTAMYSLDRSGTGTQKNIAWPAANMPIEYFDEEIPWSLSTGTTVTKENVTVTLTRVSDNKVWTFSGTDTYSTSDTKYFNVDNQGYGIKGCIIFRPDDITQYSNGDEFNVLITGAGESDISYTVKFFRAYKMTGIQFTNSEISMTEGETVSTSLAKIPSNASENINLNAVTYSSSDENVATVTSRGKITAVKGGTAVITAEYKGFTAETAVTVSHTWDTSYTVDKAATCVEDGQKSIHCTGCDSIDPDSIVVLPALGHDWGDPTYQWADNHLSVTATRTCSKTTCDECTETETAEATGVQVTPPTCHSKGETKYTSNAFSNEAFAVQTITVDDIATLPHTWDGGEVTAEPTCSQPGVRTFHCTVDECGASMEEPIAIDPDAHDWGEGVVTTEPGCTTEGVRTYTCSHNSGHTRTETIEPLGHEWGTPTYAWSGDKKKITATRVCEHITGASCTETETVSVASEVVQAPTCYSMGKTKYTPGQFKNTAFSVSEVTIEDIPMTAHNWDEGQVTDPATCSSEGTRVVHCSNSGCTAEEERTIPIDPDAHDWGEWQDIDPATCYDDGQKMRVCNHNSEHVEYQDVEKLHHSMIEHPAQDATCTEQGNIHYWQCEYCHDYFTDEDGVNQIGEEDTKTPPNGHQWEDDSLEVSKEATCTEPGEIRFTCTVCGGYVTVETNPLGHAYVECEDEPGLCRDGKNYDYCLNCGDIQNIKILPGYAKYYVNSLKVKKGKKSFTVKWKKQSKANLKKFGGYQIRYSLKSNMSGSKVVVAGKATKSRKVKGLQKKKTYYVQVRTYTVKNGKTYYSKWSTKKTVKTK